MNTLFISHSHFRWLVVVAGGLALLLFLTGWLGGRKFSKLDHILSKVFPILIDIQATMGLVLLLWSAFAGGSFTMIRHHYEHGLAMIIASVLGHMMKKWQNSPDATRFRNSFFTVVIVAALIFGGVMALPGGMARWGLA